MTKREQAVLHQKDVVVSNSDIPDDILNGVCQSDITDFRMVHINDLKNSSMFRDGSYNSTKFQQDLLKHEFMRSKKKLDSGMSKTETSFQQSLSGHNSDSDSILSEVPSIYHLQSQMQIYMKSLPTEMNHQDKSKSWNSMFHWILHLCKLEKDFPPTSLPRSYKLNGSCAHVAHVELELVATKSLHLTMFENLKGENMSGQICFFINSVIFQNPIWYIGVQHKLALKNDGKIYINKLNELRQYTPQNVYVLVC